MAMDEFPGIDLVRTLFKYQKKKKEKGKFVVVCSITSSIKRSFVIFHVEVVQL